MLVLIGFAGFLICLVALSAIPVDVKFSVQCDEGFRGSVGIGWLFGLLRMLVPSRSGKPIQDAVRAERSKKRGSLKSGRSVVAMLKSHGFLDRLIGFASDLLRSIRVRSVRIRGRLGLEEPADTGRVWSFVGPLTAILAAIPGTDIEIDPDFEHATLSLDGTGEVRIIPVEVFVAVISFVLSHATLRALWALFASRRK
jgi:hypothetical protein